MTDGVEQSITERRYSIMFKNYTHAFFPPTVNRIAIHEGNHLANIVIIDRQH